MVGYGAFPGRVVAVVYKAKVVGGKKEYRKAGLELLSGGKRSRLTWLMLRVGAEEEGGISSSKQRA